MTGGGEGAGERQLDQTPTWAVAAICASIVIISIFLEKGLHLVGQYFERRHKTALCEALEKVKGELMVLGFISLLLTFGQNYIANVCIPHKFSDTMLPCSKRGKRGKGVEPVTEHEPVAEHKRKLLWYAGRILSTDKEPTGCKEGQEPFISVEALHQLHIFIFFLAIFHVFFSAVVMMLGRLKIRGWKDWEQEALHNEESYTSKLRLAHETSFVKQNTSFWTRVPILFLILCFFRQFFRSVTRSDYLTMRHGFISVHLAPGSKFDFQKYIKRSLEDDFKVVVGISPLLWASSVFFLLVNVHSRDSLTWLSLVPLIVILAVGTKLQAIIAQMAGDIAERQEEVKGTPLVEVSDNFFWFEWPQLILYLIHYTLFQNAFEITYFFWIWYEFGLRSCLHHRLDLTIIRVAIGVGVQVLCSYITLPLYALVTQMGSTMKLTIFNEQISKALKKWHQSAKKKHGEGSSRRSSTSPHLRREGSQQSTSDRSDRSQHTIAEEG